MLLGLVNARTPFVKRDERSPNVLHRTPGERNVRVPVLVGPQEAPDQPRVGATPARAAMSQIVTFFYDTQASMEERFGVVDKQQFDHGAWVPDGQMTPLDLRQNIDLRNHIAYGSLFTYDPTLYGQG